MIVKLLHCYLHLAICLKIHASLLPRHLVATCLYLITRNTHPNLILMASAIPICALEVIKRKATGSLGTLTWTDICCLPAMTTPFAYGKKTSCFSLLLFVCSPLSLFEGILMHHPKKIGSLTPRPFSMATQLWLRMLRGTCSTKVFLDLLLTTTN